MKAGGTLRDRVDTTGLPDCHGEALSAFCLILA